MLEEPTGLSDGHRWLPWSPVRAFLYQIESCRVGSKVDIRNAYHCLFIPLSLGRYFVLPALSAKTAGLVGRRVEGRTLIPSDVVSPFSASLPMGFSLLPMGFSWGTYFCQDAALRIAAESAIPRCTPVISDRIVEIQLCSTEANATEIYSMMAKSMIRVGLQVYDEVCATCDAEALGVRRRFETGVATVSTDRKWRPQSGCHEFAHLLGHQTFAFSLARGSLSILFVSYKLARATYLEPLLNPAEEQGKSPSPQSEMCYSSDASLTGGAFLTNTASSSIEHSQKGSSNLNMVSSTSTSGTIFLLAGSCLTDGDTLC